MKICPKCRRTLPLASFNRKSTATDGLQPWCRSCNAEKSKNYYAENAAHVKKSIYASRTKRIGEVQRKIFAYFKEHPCVKCGFDHPAALDFDHLGDKTDNISRMVTSGSSWSKVLNEIEKCQVLCSNCHRIKTAEDFGWYKRSELPDHDAILVPRRDRSMEEML